MGEYSICIPGSMQKNKEQGNGYDFRSFFHLGPCFSSLAEHFYLFRASVFVKRLILCCSEALVDGFLGYHIYERFGWAAGDEEEEKEEIFKILTFPLKKVFSRLTTATSAAASPNRTFQNFRASKPGYRHIFM